MSADWQFIPSDVLNQEQEQNQQRADNWASRARASVAAEWAQLHVEDALSSVRQCVASPGLPWFRMIGAWASLRGRSQAVTPVPRGTHLLASRS